VSSWIPLPFTKSEISSKTAKATDTTNIILTADISTMGLKIIRLV